MLNRESAVSASAVGAERTFFGEPIALAYLSFTEAWERFSYYGMTALLVLYMSEALLRPGRIEHVVGFPTFRAALESVLGPMSTLALSSQIFGLYSGFVYFTPVLGGMIADRGLGRRNSVVLGALMMSAGHWAMAFDASFLLALLLLIVGCGLLKGNISTQVGELYSEQDGAGRTRGFSIYSVGINVGAVAGPLACGLLAQLYGWHAGFGLAGCLMLIGLGTYLAGYKLLVEKKGTLDRRSTTPALNSSRWRIIAALLVVMALTVFQSIAYYQNTNMNLVWIDRNVDLALFGFHMPVAWFNSIDACVSIISVPPLFAFWRWQKRHGGEPTEIMKIATGAWIAAAANMVLVMGCLLTKRVPVFVPVIYDVLLGIAFLYYWPTLLALVSRAAPAGMKSTLMGCVFLSLFVAALVLGWIGTLYEKMPPVQFWSLHAAIAVVGAVLALLLNRPLTRLLAHNDE